MLHVPLSRSVRREAIIAMMVCSCEGAAEAGGCASASRSSHGLVLPAPVILLWGELVAPRCAGTAAHLFSRTATNCLRAAQQFTTKGGPALFLVWYRICSQLVRAAACAHIREPPIVACGVAVLGCASKERGARCSCTCAQMYYCLR